MLRASLNYSNNPPIFEDIANNTLSFTFTKYENSVDKAPFLITLGPVFDPEGDSPRLSFDPKGNSFISIDKSDLADVTLSVNQVAPIGVHTVTVSLSDDNDIDLVSKDYRIIIVIHEGLEDQEDYEELTAIDEYEPPASVYVPLLTKLTNLTADGSMNLLFSKPIKPN